MASRKEQKEQARAARIAQQQQAAAKAQRTRRLQIFGGAIAIAVIVIVVAVVVSSGGGKPKGTTTGLASGAKQHQIVKSVNSLFAGIPENGTTLGNPKAKVTMMYFGDLECPVCQAFTLEILPQFIQDQVRTGKVKLVYRSMCTATCDGNLSKSQKTKFFDGQQTAAYAAGLQHKFWQYADLFYHQQKEEGTGYATNAFLTGLAKQVNGLNLTKWRTDTKDPSLLDQVDSDESFAVKAALPGTPSLIMKGPKNEELVDDGNFPSYSDLTTAVKAVS